MVHLLIFDANKEIESFFTTSLENSPEFEIYFHPLLNLENEVKKPHKPLLCLMCLNKKNVQNILQLRKPMQEKLSNRDHTFMIMVFSKIDGKQNILFGDYEGTRIKFLDNKNLTNVLIWFLEENKKLLQL